MKSILFKCLTLILAFIFGFGLLSAPVFAVDADENICDNDHISAEIKAASGCDGNTEDQLRDTIVNIIDAIIGILGLVAVCFVIYGGVQYMTSAGDSAKTQKAKNTILYALIGLIVCVLAYAIVNWAIGTLTPTPGA